jgi:putative ABC transport system permease protein
MFRLAHRNLWTRLARTLLTVAAIALGVGVVFATRIVAVAVGQATGEARAGRLSGADLEVTSATRAHLRAGLAEEIAGRPEVEASTPIYRRLEGAFDTSVPLTFLGGTYPFTGTGLMLLGVDPGNVLAPYALAEGEFLSAPDAAEVLLPATWAAQHRIAVGERITLVTGAQARTFTVVGTRGPDPSESFSGRPTAWLPLAVMQSSFDTPGAATAILVRLGPGTTLDVARDQLQTTLGPLYIVTSATGGSSSRSLLITITDAALPFAGIAVLLGGAFLVYNAFAITVAERRREIGQLRTLGMTRRQVLRHVLLEALLVGALGSGLGLLLGFGLGRGMMEVVVGAMQGLPVPKASFPVGGALLAVGIGLFVTLTVTWNLAWKAGRFRPLETLQKGQLRGVRGERPVWRGWVGLVGSLLFFLAANAAATRALRQARSLNVVAVLFLPPFLLAAAALFALPPGVRGVLAVCQRAAGRLGVASRLAMENLSLRRTRAALTAATLTIGLMLVTALAGITLVMKGFFQDNLLPLFEADFMLVRPSTEDSFEYRVSLPSLPPLSPELAAELSALSTEAEVAFLANIQLPGYGSGPALDNGWALSLELVRDSPIYRPKEGSWAEAERTFAQGPAMTLPEIASRRLDLHPGDVVEVDTFEGQVSFQIALVGGPLPLVTHEVGARHFHSHPFIIVVNARPGIDKAALEARLQALAQDHALAFSSDTQRDFSDAINSLFDVVLWLFASLTSIAGLVAGLGIANTLAASVIERRREIGVLRAVGMTRTQVRRLIVTEAGLLGLTGSLVGALAGLAMTLAFNYLVGVFGEAVGFAPMTQVPLPWVVAGAAIVAGPVTAILAALYPAARAARVDPAVAMRAEGTTGLTF